MQRSTRSSFIGTVCTVVADIRVVVALSLSCGFFLCNCASFLRLPLPEMQFLSPHPPPRREGGRERERERERERRHLAGPTKDATRATHQKAAAKRAKTATTATATTTTPTT